MQLSWSTLLVGSALALLTPACGGDDDPDVVIIEDSVGLLTVRWSIAGSLDPASCALSGADALELVVFDFDGFVVREVEAFCEDFEVTIELIADTYSADATLVDGLDQAVSFTEQLDNLRIVGSTELVVDVDFPPGSILNETKARD